ncbi:MAG: DUF6524 family protein [Proteobacteria bacterium]|nr:DUF6524 family protein [Pseudomonadota bacterium]
MAASHLTCGGFFVRWLTSLVLVFATFNPFGFSYFHWVTGGADKSLPLVALLGLMLVIGYAIFLRATFCSIGPAGVVLLVAFFAIVIWLLADFELIELKNFRLLVTLGLLIAATVMAIGMSWSFIRRRLSGQYDVDDADE